MYPHSNVKSWPQGERTIVPGMSGGIGTTENSSGCSAGVLEIHAWTPRTARTTATRGSHFHTFDLVVVAWTIGGEAM
jgi:hypothetical protein